MITTRQTKVRQSLIRLNARLGKFLRGEYDKKYQKTFTSNRMSNPVVEDPDDYDGYRVVYDSPDKTPNWVYWRDCDMYSLKKQIRRKLKELEKAIELDKREENRTERKQYEKKEREQVMVEMPQCIKDFRDAIERQFVESQLKQREECLALPKPTWEDRKKNRQRALTIEYYQEITEEKIREEGKRFAEDLVLNMMLRIGDRVGKITDVSGLHITVGNSKEYAAINGTIFGEKGHVNIKSIGAGGYNIVKYHIRVLIN